MLGALTLRLWNLGRQILVGDEIHSLNIALNEPVVNILFTYRESDPCLPLTALFRLLMDWGVRLSEPILRAPSLVAGLAAVVVLPWVARPWLSRGERLLWAWLVALSALLVLYSRIVRPYALVACVGPLAVLAFLRWWLGERRLWAALYVLAALASVWLHLTTAPFVLAPFAFAAVHASLSREGKRGWRDLLVLAGLTAAGLAALLIPAAASLVQLMEEKGGTGFVLRGSVLSALALLAGVVERDFAALFWLAAVWGLARLFAGRAVFALFALSVVTAQWLGLIVLRPGGLGHPLILTRYLVVTLPLVLAMVACGLYDVARRLVGPLVPGAGRAAARAAVLGAALVLYVAAGPFMDEDLRRSSFMHWSDFLQFDSERGEIPPRKVPSFYYGLAEQDDGGVVAEFPFRGGWAATRAHYVYQTVHGRPVLAAAPGGLFCDERLALVNHVCAEPPAILTSQARYLIVHRRIRREERWVEGGNATGLLVDQPGWRRHHSLARNWQRKLRRSWGRPVYRSRAIMAWDLDLVRRRLSEKAISEPPGR